MRKFNANMRNPVWLAVISLFSTLPQSLSLEMEPCVADYKAFRPCAKVHFKNPFVYNQRFSRTSRKNFTISFDVYAPHGVNDNVILKLDLDMKTQNGFKSLHKGEYRLVTSIRQFTPFTDEKYGLKFPMPPGNYSVEKLPLSPDPTPDTFFYNTFRARVTSHWKGERTSCTETIVEYIPRKIKHSN